MELKNTVSTTEYNQIHEELQNNIAKMREQVMNSKLKKSEWDTKDCMHNRVYTWALERTRYRKMRNYDSQVNSERSSGESDDTGKMTWRQEKTHLKKGDMASKSFLQAREDTGSFSSDQASDGRTLRSKDLLINISSKPFNKEQEILINKGLNFVLTFRMDKFDFFVDFYKFCRSIRLHIFFADKKSGNKEINNITERLQSKSQFDPQFDNPALDHSNM